MILQGIRARKNRWVVMLVESVKVTRPVALGGLCGMETTVQITRSSEASMSGRVFGSVWTLKERTPLGSRPSESDRMIGGWATLNIERNTMALFPTTKTMKLVYPTLLLALGLLRVAGADIVTLHNSGASPYTLAADQVAEVIASVAGNGWGTITFVANSQTNNLYPAHRATSGEVTSMLPLVIAGPVVFLPNGFFLTLRIRSKTEYLSSLTTPTAVSSTSVVIPADAAGPVTIALESSTDLVTWTAANPGTYGSSTAKRFFRVRAINN